MNDVPKIADNGRDHHIETNVIADREALRAIRQLLVDSAVVSRAEIEPTCHEPQMVRAYLADKLCPSSSRSFEMEIRWFTSGGFSIHCLETSQDANWWCRWEHYRHMDATPAHFHHPPDGNPIAELEEFPDHPLDIVLTALNAVEQHLSLL